MELPFLQSKISLPPVRRRAVPRAGLAGRLDELLEPGYRLGLLYAPAGYGKTSLLAAWLADLPARTGARLAWLACEPADNDPLRFWSYCLAALRGLEAGLGARSRSLLQIGQPVPLEALLSLLLDDLAQLEGPVVWALDDLHLVPSAEIQRGLAFLVDHLPPHVRLVMATRSQPRLPLARLRGRNQLLELRPDDLAFDLPEAIAFFHHTMQLPLADEAAAAVCRRTQGWVAGMQLAALSLRERPGLAGDPGLPVPGAPAMLAYYQQEVLDGLPQERQNFLFTVSILERLNGDLCRAVTGREDSGELLAQLEHDNLFLSPLDAGGAWYGFHPLFRDLLVRRLERALDPEQVRHLHRRAAEWFEQGGWSDAAIPHALAAGEYPQAARLLMHTGLRRILSGEAGQVQAAIRAIPEDWLAGRPDLLVLLAWTVVAAARFEQAGEIVARAAAALTRPWDGSPDRETLEGHLAAIQATAAFNQRDVEACIQQAGIALELLPESEQAVRSVVMLDLADALLNQGRLEPARQRYLETAALAHRAGNTLIEVNSFSLAGRVLFWQGELYQAQAEYRLALRAAEEAGLGDLPVVGLAEEGLADLYIEWDDLEQAHFWNARSLDHFHQWGHREHISRATLARAEIFFAAGRTDAAQEALVEAQALAQHGHPSRSFKWAGVLSAQICRRRGQTVPGLRVLCSAGFLEESGDPGQPYRPRAGLHPMQLNQDPVGICLLDESGATALAQAWLADWLAQAHRAGLGRQVTRLLVVQALLDQAHRRPDAALESLGQALALGEPQGLRRTFTAGGVALAGLLEAWLARNPAPGRVREYAGGLRAACRPPEAVSPAPARVETGPLSGRERQVLRLAAAGLTNDEIARQLVVSINTVKTHLKRIFDKLGANTRREAVEQARQLGLLDG
ncbi:MAG: LuxR C-terminal-related transcriptional regulator [Anaerolineaceae bacterium]|nr:LuxR C-terminal-related transcriptional regulator [Anaerolineaceae bacterium]